MLPAADLNMDASSVYDDAHTALADCLSAIVVTVCGHVQSGACQRAKKQALRETFVAEDARVSVDGCDVSSLHTSGLRTVVY